MKKLITAKNIIIAVLALTLIFGGIHSCNVNNQKDAQITQLQFDNQTLDSVSNTKGQKIIEQAVIVTQSKQALKDATDSLFALKARDARKIKDVIAFYKGITELRIDSVPVPYVDSVARQHFSDSVEAACSDVIQYYESNFISVPRVAEDSNSRFKAKIEVFRDDIKLSLQVLDSQYIRFATLKGGLLKKNVHGKRQLFLAKQIVVQVLHTNDLITVTGQNSAIYKAPKKPHWFEKALLIGVGVYLGTKL